MCAFNSRLRHNYFNTDTLIYLNKSVLTQTQDTFTDASSEKYALKDIYNNIHVHTHAHIQTYTQLKIKYIF